MALPRVLVLLAVHNGLPFLQDQLQTLAGQQQVSLQVDISDDASTDGSPALCAEWAATDPRFRSVNPPGPGGSAAQNFFRLLIAADLRDVDYVAFCDHDDLWHADRLIRGVERLQFSGAALYSSATRAFWPDQRSRVLGQVAEMTQADFLFEGAGQGCSFLLTVAFARQVQALLQKHQPLLAGIHYHDWAVYAAARALGLPWVFDAQSRLDYRQHDGNDTGARASGGGVRKRLALIRNGWYAAQVAAISAWVAAVAPQQPALQAWQRAKVGSRIGRALWLARHGRRRGADRAVQVLAALAGWL